VDTFAKLRRERKGVERSQGRRHFTDEFKREAVALLVSSGRPLSRIASELGISPSMLRNWRNGSGGRDAGSARHTSPAAGRA
jgi:transposase